MRPTKLAGQLVLLTILLLSGSACSAGPSKSKESATASTRSTQTSPTTASPGAFSVVAIGTPVTSSDSTATVLAIDPALAVDPDPYGITPTPGTRFLALNW